MEFCVATVEMTFPEDELDEAFSGVSSNDVEVLLYVEEAFLLALTEEFKAVLLMSAAIRGLCCDWLLNGSNVGNLKKKKKNNLK